MPKFFTLKIILLCLALPSFILGGCAARHAARPPQLPADLSLGQITGPGAEEIVKILRRHLNSQKGGRVLSGRLSFQDSFNEEREKVAQKVAVGEPREAWLADPFTKKYWLEEETDYEERENEYKLQRSTGVLIFDWSVGPAGGAPSRSGRIELDTDATGGGFLGSIGAAPKAGGRPSGRKLAEVLGEDLVALLALELGRQLKASDLDWTSDAQSRQAHKLAGEGCWDEARDIWLQLLELNPEYGPALYNLALYYEYKGQPQEALAYYQRAFLSDSSPRNRAALTRLTKAVANQDRQKGGEGSER